ncbi:MAG TPA: hypothetical protein DEB06_07255, partial [Phycisphaerales bacterium]|nr:hypothetical protein [Phycisphaerales bacterium]
STPPSAPPSAPLTRAAELAARARRLVVRSAEISRRLTTDPDLSDSPPELRNPPPSPVSVHQPPMHAIETAPLPAAHLIGAHDTGDGVLFAH